MEALLPNGRIGGGKEIFSIKIVSIRKIQFANGEFYHVYNRGTDKRPIFSDASDVSRFIQSMQEFNSLDPIGSIYEHCRAFGSKASKR